MRWYVLKTLLFKELLRLLNNRGGLAMTAVMVVAAVLAAAFGDATLASLEMRAGAPQCIVDYWQEDGWVKHLKASVPASLEGRVRFRSLEGKQGTIGYPPGVAAIQLRPPSDGERFKIWVWYPDRDGAAVAPFEVWFWSETRRYFAASVGQPAPAAGDAEQWYRASHELFREQLRQALAAAGRPEAIAGVPELAVERSKLVHRDVGFRAGAAMFLVLMALCFVCIFLMPSATAEERERGALLAQALSPASSLEILGAKLLFYPTLAMFLASLVAGICHPAVWSLSFFWLATAITALGTVGIGLTLSVLARTQRGASMGALSYMLAVALLLLVSRGNGWRFPALLMIENHGPAMLLAALNDSVRPEHWGQLGLTWVLAVVWCGLATALFRRFGWQ